MKRKVWHSYRHSLILGGNTVSAFTGHGYTAFAYECKEKAEGPKVNWQGLQ